MSETRQTILNWAVNVLWVFTRALLWVAVTWLLTRELFPLIPELHFSEPGPAGTFLGLCILDLLGHVRQE